MPYKSIIHELFCLLVFCNTMSLSVDVLGYLNTFITQDKAFVRLLSVNNEMHSLKNKFFYKKRKYLYKPKFHNLWFGDRIQWDIVRIKEVPLEGEIPHFIRTIEFRDRCDITKSFIRIPGHVEKIKIVVASCELKENMLPKQVQRVTIGENPLIKIRPGGIPFGVTHVTFFNDDNKNRSKYHFVNPDDARIVKGSLPESIKSMHVDCFSFKHVFLSIDLFPKSLEILKISGRYWDGMSLELIPPWITSLIITTSHWDLEIPDGKFNVEYLCC